MATIHGYTAERMQQILNSQIASVAVDEIGHLIATKYDATVEDLGSVLGPIGPEGPAGPVHLLGELDDADTTGASAGDAWVFNGTQWVPRSIIGSLARAAPRPYAPNSTNSTAPINVDGGTLQVTPTIPETGRVSVTVSFGYSFNVSNALARFDLHDGTAHVPYSEFWVGNGAGSGATDDTFSVTLLIDDLTPAATPTWKLRWSVFSSSYTISMAGGSTVDAGPANPVIIVEAA